MFGVLATDLVRRQMIVPGALTGGLTAQLFTVPGKGTALSRRRGPRDRERDGGQCRNRDRGRRCAHRLYSRCRSGDAGDGARRLRRDAVGA
jgi:hypothetical protein